MLEEIIRGKNKILIVVAHPDDMEGYFGGTLLSLINQNILNPEQIHLVVSSDGSKGGRDKIKDINYLIKQREQEQSEALKMLSIPESNLIMLGLEDGYLMDHERSLIKHISNIMRKVKPDMVFTHNPDETVIPIFNRKENSHYFIHRDHRIVGRAALDAVYPYSRDVLFNDEESSNVPGHHLFEFLLCETSKPNLNVNVSKVIEDKKELLMKFTTQFESLEYATEHQDTFNLDHSDNQYYERFRYVKIVN